MLAYDTKPGASHLDPVGHGKGKIWRQHISNTLDPRGLARITLTIVECRYASPLGEARSIPSRECPMSLSSR